MYDPNMSLKYQFWFYKAKHFLNIKKTLILNEIKKKNKQHKKMKF